ncbi:M20 family metallopeptidase [Azohydromonas lata]|uniref:M20 family metallopeptidase n=1 Tax=Azohydromonas lata TaxID=45677 RepID=UPI00082DD9FC|nr:M20/M25/M40 family metallo-hydrolase [Azohydromonas lata]
MPSLETDFDVPADAITALLQSLVRTPSRAGEDAMAPVLDVAARWFQAHALPCERLMGDDGQPLGLYAEVQGRSAGSWMVLNATLDTAGFGDPGTWERDPVSGDIEGGCLHGRGGADSKAGAALFAHLLAHCHARRDRWAGRLGLLLDVDEHTGGFGGARHFFGGPPARRPDGVLIGYPGCERLMLGARGFLRARLDVAGEAAHAGSGSRRGANAVLRAAALAQALAALDRDLASRADAPDAPDAFPLPPCLTVTALHGGAGFTQVPDRCELLLDLRLTPAVDAAAMRSAVETVVQAQDATWPGLPATAVHWQSGWPAYRLADAHPLVAALRAGAADALGRTLPGAVAGPSNIGNYLAGLGVPALCGFGVAGGGVHAANEWVALESIAPVFRAYAGALGRLLGV